MSWQLAQVKNSEGEKSYRIQSGIRQVEREMRLKELNLIEMNNNNKKKHINYTSHLQNSNLSNLFTVQMCCMHSDWESYSNLFRQKTCSRLSLQEVAFQKQDLIKRISTLNSLLSSRNSLNFTA